MIEQTVPENDYYPELKIKKAFVGDARGLVSNGINRYLLDGTMVFARIDSKKFGDELQMTVYTKENFFQKEPANKTPYRRVEFFLSFEEIDKVIAALEELKNGRNSDSRD